MKIMIVRAVVFDPPQTLSTLNGNRNETNRTDTFTFLALLSYAWAQSPKPKSIAELAIYTGSDREQLLYAGAKSEGTVTWYTSLAGDSYKALARAFEAKYPGVRVESYRAGGSELVVPHD